MLRCMISKVVSMDNFIHEGHGLVTRWHVQRCGSRTKPAAGCGGFPRPRRLASVEKGRACQGGPRKTGMHPAIKASVRR